MELSSTEHKHKLSDCSNCAVSGSGDVVPEDYEVREQLIEQEAARLSSLAIQSALQYLNTEQNGGLSNQSQERSTGPARKITSDAIKMTVMPLEMLGGESSVNEGEVGEESSSAAVGDSRGQSCGELIDIEEFLRSEAENLYYSELCIPDTTPIAGFGEGQQITPPPNLSQATREAEPSSCEVPKRLINLDWAKAKEFKPRRPVLVQTSQSNSVLQCDMDQSLSVSSDGQCFNTNNTNNCHDRMMPVKLIGQEDSQAEQHHPIYHDPLDLSIEDNSLSDVLDIIVLPDSDKTQAAEHTCPNSGCSSRGATYTNPPMHRTKPSMSIYHPPPPAPHPPRPNYTPLSTSRVPINMILPVRPPCRPPFNLHHPSLPPFRHPALFLPQTPHLPARPTAAHMACSPHLPPPTRHPGADYGPHYPPPVGCFYPPDVSPPPSIQYGYSQRGKRRKAQRLSSRFPTQAGKFHHHANFYVKSCAESVVAQRTKMDSQQHVYQPPASRSH